LFQCSEAQAGVLKEKKKTTEREEKHWTENSEGTSNITHLHQREELTGFRGKGGWNENLKESNKGKTGPEGGGLKKKKNLPAKSKCGGR